MNWYRGYNFFINNFCFRGVSEQNSIVHRKWDLWWIYGSQRLLNFILCNNSTVLAVKFVECYLRWLFHIFSSKEKGRDSVDVQWFPGKFGRKPIFFWQCDEFHGNNFIHNHKHEQTVDHFLSFIKEKFVPIQMKEESFFLHVLSISMVMKWIFSWWIVFMKSVIVLWFLLHSVPNKNYT